MVVEVDVDSIVVVALIRLVVDVRLVVIDRLDVMEVLLMDEDDVVLVFNPSWYTFNRDPAPQYSV